MNFTVEGLTQVTQVGKDIPMAAGGPRKLQSYCRDPRCFITMAKEIERSLGNSVHLTRLGGVLVFSNIVDNQALLASAKYDWLDELVTLHRHFTIESWGLHAHTNCLKVAECGDPRVQLGAPFDEQAQFYAEMLNLATIELGSLDRAARHEAQKPGETYFEAYIADTTFTQTGDLVKLQMNHLRFGTMVAHGA